MIDENNKIVLMSVFGNVGQKYYFNPCPDPKTGRFPDFVKKVNSQGDMILTDKERNSGEYFIKETDVFVFESGHTFDLTNDIERKQWEAIKNSSLIAPSRFAKDENGNNLIDGTMGWKNKNPRYGSAELYVYQPEADTRDSVEKLNKYRVALNYIYDDEKGYDGRLLKCKLLGKRMDSVPDSEVIDYLSKLAKSNPDKIIDLYRGTDTNLRLLFIEGKEKKVIYIKNKLYMYGDNIILGPTDDSVINWMKDPKNKKLLEIIKRDVYPELYSEE